MAAGEKANIQVLGTVDDAMVRGKLSKLSGPALSDALQASERQMGQRYLSSLISATPRGKRGNLQAAQRFKIGMYRSAAVLMFGPQWRGGQHQHLVEWGTKERFTKARRANRKKGITGKRKRSRGRMPAQHYMERWFDSNGPRIRADLVDEVNNQLGKELYG